MDMDEWMWIWMEWILTTSPAVLNLEALEVSLVLLYFDEGLCDPSDLHSNHIISHRPSISSRKRLDERTDGLFRG